MDFARARRTMVDTQIRVNDVTDPAIIDALLAVPREDFVPDSRRVLAYLDDDLPVIEPTHGKPGRYLMEPMVLAKMLQAAGLAPDSRVLHVGAATGYTTAVLARLAAQVTAVEEDASLAAIARDKLAGTHVTLVEGPHADGASARAPFDVILAEGSVEVIPEVLFTQLAEGGRLVAVVGRGRSAKCVVHTRRNGETSALPVFDAALPPLPGFSAPHGFVF